MAERKVINKYLPPDLDPSRIPRMKNKSVGEKPSDVRMMVPFNLTCSTCGCIMRAGKKFNGKKEHAKGMDYLGIERFRFRLKCEDCKAILTFLTDPKHNSYEMESGGTRNFDATREENDDAIKSVIEKPLETEKDAMKLLEQRTLESKREMEMLDKLEMLRQKNLQRDKYAIGDILNPQKEDDDASEAIEASDDLFAAEVFREKNKVIRRLDDEVHVGENASNKSDLTMHENLNSESDLLPGLCILKKRKRNKESKQTTKKPLGIVSYDSDSDS